MELASSLSSASEKARRGLRGLGLRNSIGTLRWLRGRSTCAASPPTSPIRLARPRPNRERASSAAIASSLGFTRSTPELELHNWCGGRASMRAQLALALDHFGRELEVRFAANAFEIVDQHRLAVGRRLGDAHVARDHGVVDLAAHELAHVRDDLVRQVVAAVEHGQHDAVDRQVRIERGLYLL